jgi:hypothetical protein
VFLGTPNVIHSPTFTIGLVLLGLPFELTISSSDTQVSALVLDRLLSASQEETSQFEVCAAISPLRGFGIS